MAESHERRTQDHLSSPHARLHLGLVLVPLLILVPSLSFGLDGLHLGQKLCLSCLHASPVRVELLLGSLEAADRPQQGQQARVPPGLTPDPVPYTLDLDTKP